MRKHRLLTTAICCLVFCCYCMAEDVIQVMPFRTTAGVTADDGQYFQIHLNNSEECWGIQFEMILPEGLTLDEYPFELIRERVPTRRGQMLHGVDYNIKDGTVYVVVSPNTDDYLLGNSGALLNVYYSTAADMPEGIHPIRINKPLIVFRDGHVRPGTSSSYMITGDSPLSSQPAVDLSCLTGYIPSFVMEQANRDLALNPSLLSLDLTEAEDIGENPSLAESNALCYIKAGTKAETTLADVPNIVVKDGDTYRCRHLLLNEKYPFSCRHTMYADNAVLMRTPVSSQWNTLCLPFALGTSQLEAAYGAGCYAQELTNLENDALCFSTTAGGTQANVPCLLYVPAACENEEYAYGAVTVLPTPEIPEMTVQDIRFQGNYAGHRSATGLYGVTPDSRIRRGGTGAMLQGFRACLDLSGTTRPTTLCIRHDNATGLCDIQTGNTNARCDVYSPDGRLLRKNVLRSEAVKGLPHGLYVVGHQKIIK